MTKTQGGNADFCHANAVTVLQDIIDGASGDSVPVSSLLRKLKVLAARTQTPKLAEWVDYELEGYPDGVSIPAYRGPFNPPVLGHFVGAYGAQARNVQIPPSTFPPELREGHLFKIWLCGPVAEIEQMASSESTTFSWPPDGERYYNHAVQKGEVTRVVREDLILAQVVRPLARQYVVGALDTVRTRILDLALELETVAPAAGQPEASNMDRDHARQIINNYNFLGSASNVAIGREVVQFVGLPQAGDQDSLVRYLAAVGVHPRDLVELEQAIEADSREQSPDESSGPGRRVRNWLGRAATDVGTGASGGLIVEAVNAFFGG